MGKSRKQSATSAPLPPQNATETLPPETSPAPEPESNGKVSVVRDQSNRPTYAVFATCRLTGSNALLWEFPTIGQARKMLPMIVKAFGTSHKELRLVKVKLVSNV